MSKDKTLNTIKACFDQIINGNKEDSRLAARRVRKLLYSARGGGDKYKEVEDIINNAPINYAAISEVWRQENFVSAVSVIYYLHDQEAQPDFLFPWFFLLLNHANGVIRYAAVRMITHEFGLLTVHIRFPGEKREYKLKPEQADSILRALFIKLHQMLNALSEPKYKKYKYIDSLPVSPYKSVQMVLAELEDMCGGRKIL